MSVTEYQSKGARIVVRDVTKTYPGKEQDVYALKPVSFEIEAGEFVSLIGPSGCGKSTLMLIVAGLLAQTAGEVRINDELLTKPLTDVGIVFQDHLLLDFRTAINNILLQTQVRNYPKEKARQEALRLLDQLGLKDAEDRYPNQLSGGMRQRVSLGRALIHEPSVLLMDEPFGALDAITRTQMRLDLERLWLKRRMTVLFITHSVEEAVGLSDRVIVMSPGPGEIVNEIKIDLPRPRPVDLGLEQAYVEYADLVFEEFKQLGVLRV
jgi:NitT/TauT family transport system ATP-binding protein